MRRLVLTLIFAGLAGGIWTFLQKFQIDDLQDLASVFGDGDAAASTNPIHSAPPVARTGDTIRIATFNIQVFGESKSRKTHVMQTLAQIVRNFDVVAIQEIRAKNQDILPQFVELVNEPGRNYDFVIGPRIGRTHSKEQYAFVFDQASVEVDRNQLYTIDDPDDRLHREPYIGWFRVRGPPADQAFTFTLVNIHTDPDETDQELDALDDVFRAVRDDGRGEDDIVILGDLNVDDKNLGELGAIPGITWVVSGTPTNTRGTRQYDNIVFDERATTEFTGRYGVFDFLREYNLTIQEALEVSDHLPVWAEFSVFEGGKIGHVAGRSDAESR